MQFKKAFSLIELSVSIVIIGILIVGVSSGAKLVANAKFAKVAEAAISYKKAIESFVLIYRAYPGDLANASDIFGNNCAEGDSAECNGNGNRLIDFGLDNTDEKGKVLHHLALAGLYKGNHAYRPNGHADSEGTVCNAAARGTVSGVTGPVIGDNHITISANSDFVPGEKLRLLIGGSHCDNYPISAKIRSQDAEKFDLKFDDGIAESGDVISSAGSPDFTGCLTNSQYDVSLSEEDCFITWRVLIDVL